MNKEVFIINGQNSAGKDTFVAYVASKLQYPSVINFSSVDKIKDIARIIGWDGTKTERNRKFLFDLKVLCSEYNDMPFNSMKDIVNEFYRFTFYRMLFLHIREPEEIERAKNEFNAKTILVVRDSVEQVTSNIADKNVFNYDYDIIIDNNGTLKDLSNKATDFVNDFIISSYINNSFKNKY